MRNRRKAAGDVRLDHPPAAPPALINEHLQGIVRRSSRAEPETDRQEIRLEDPLEHHLQRGPPEPGNDRGNRKQPPVPRTPPWGPNPPARRGGAGPPNHGRLCCPPGSTGPAAASDADPASNPLPGLTGYRTPRSGDTTPQVTGPGRAAPVPAATIDTFRAPYAGESLTAALQDLHRFHGLRPDFGRSALPAPARR